MANVQPAAIRPRTHVTLQYSGKDPLPLPKVGDVVITLKPGMDNMVPIAYFHAIGADTKTADLIVKGVIKAVCGVEHDFRDGEEHCRNCGHNRESAAAAAAKTIGSAPAPKAKADAAT